MISYNKLAPHKKEVDMVHYNGSQDRETQMDRHEKVPIEDERNTHD